MKNSKDTLGDRMKQYELCYRTILPTKLPIVLRLDGISFSKYTRGLQKPFDENFISAMNTVAIELCKEIQGAKLAYTQSDEISILIYEPSFDSTPWFGNSLNKILTDAASWAASTMTEESTKVFGKIKRAKFDCRLIVLPKEEVVNIFEWRQQDCRRNSVSMVARAHFSHKQCDHKNSASLKEMLKEKEIIWDDLPPFKKYGRCIVRYSSISEEKPKWTVDNSIPIFHKNREYIENLLS